MAKKLRQFRKKEPWITSVEDTEEGSDKPYRSLLLKKAEAVDLLNGSKMPSNFRFREREMGRIEAFLDACVKEKKKGLRFLMLTGAPGAGKSLCANTVLSQYECMVIKMNSNIVKTLQETQRVIASQLLGKIGQVPHTTLQIINLLEETKFDKVCVIFIEEIELLFKSDPNHLTEDFMKLFQKKGLRLILIGISNTIDTLLKSSSKFCFKMHDVENIIFSPYSAANISEIIKDKLEQIRAETGLKVNFSDRLLKFTSQKLETLKKGDLRACLEFLKCVVQRVMQVQTEEEEGFIVKIQRINDVLKKMETSKHMEIQKLPYQQKLMLIAIYIIFRKTDALCVTPLELQPEVQWVCQSLRLDYSKQLLSDGLSELEQYSLVQLKQKKDGQKILLKVGLKDIQKALHENLAFKKFFHDT